MHTEDVLKYGQNFLLNAIEGLPDSEWETPGVCGHWSVKDILAHLASFEHLLLDVISSLLGAGATPYLDMFTAEGVDFNDDQVAMRKDKSPAEVRAELRETHAKVAELITHLPPERRRQTGALPWYGDGYDLQDFIVYSSYAHKREHAAQINVFRDRLAGKMPIQGGT